MALSSPIEAWLQMQQMKNQNKQQFNQNLGGLGAGLASMTNALHPLKSEAASTAPFTGSTAGNQTFGNAMQGGGMINSMIGGSQLSGMMGGAGEGGAASGAGAGAAGAGAWSYLGLAAL